MNGQISSATVGKLLAAGIILLLLIKLFLAARLGLYSDEIFYWLASTRPAIAYSDLPFMTALLVGVGAVLDAENTLAVRILFILMGSSVPLVVYWLALPVTGKRQAMESAALALCIPLGGFLGLLAVPDVPLLFFGLFSIGFFERALRTNQLAYWLGTGLFVALGLSTHYRFFLYPAAAVLFLIVFKGERKQWQNPRLWLAMCLASLGLIPIIWFNLENQLASANFYFVERHPWEFQASGLLHVFKQAGVVTPPMYILFGFILWRLLSRDRRGDRNAILFASFGLSNIAVYLVLAPWTDASSTSLHWPLSGYFPLLVFAPSALREIYSWAERRWNSRVARNFTVAIPIIGFIGSVVALAGIGSQAFQLPLQRVLGTGILSNKMAGWNEFSDHTTGLINSEFGGDLPVVISDNYYTAAQVEFAGLSRDVFTLDKDKAIRDGRITQIRLWEKDESGLVKNIGRPVLYITEDSTLTIPDKEVAIGQMCRHVSKLDYLGGLSLFNGDKQFSFYIADAIINVADVADSRAKSCPFPARAWIDLPVADDELSGSYHVEGWAYKEDIGIDSIYLLIDGKAVDQVNYGAARSDVVEVMEVKTDPNSPNLGFSYELDTLSIANGEHTLEIQLLDEKGVSALYGKRLVKVNN